ncbi:ras-related protein Rab-34 isoform X2 [Pteropus vampyrus]|uniref:Ras-related protein Rab-36 n=1 Tax=Pteropus vampyrus TaxID=132908 RepID=A0A6P6CFW5_PTEVA|nr:ras-related protein Rab-34 isoform X2 [Pteropus vampyrus]
MVGPPQPRVVVGSPRPRVIVGTIRPRVIVGSARAREPRDGTPRPHLATEGPPRPRVIFGTPRARVIVGSPRPQVIVSSPWPAVVVASPRPRAPVGSPWPRVIVGTPRSRVIVGSARARVAGADQASAPSLGAPQGRRQDEHSGAGAEGPRPGGAAPVPEEGGRFARAQRFPPPRHLRLPGTPDRHRGVSWRHPKQRKEVSGDSVVKARVMWLHCGLVAPLRPLPAICRFKISKVIVVGDLSVGKTCLINRFCKDTFDKNYKATIGVDFEMERFEVLGIPFSLQLWDTAGQERFKCIASTYYRGAQAIIIVFNLNDVASLEHTKQWLADALRENDPSSVLLFLVGSKKDLSTPAQYVLMERDALKVAQEMKAEYWAVSSLTGINSDDNNLYLTANKKKPTCCP